MSDRIDGATHVIGAHVLAWVTRLGAAERDTEANRVLTVCRMPDGSASVRIAAIRTDRVFGEFDLPAPAGDELLAAFSGSPD